MSNDEIKGIINQFESSKDIIEESEAIWVQCPSCGYVHVIFEDMANKSYCNCGQKLNRNIFCDRH